MKILFILLLALSSSPMCMAQRPDIDPSSLRKCQELLASNIKAWKADALNHLAGLAKFPLYPVYIAPISAQLIGAALNVKPDGVSKLKDFTVTVTVENQRAELHINNWPNFQRALVSLKSPVVLKDFSLVEITPKTQLYFARNSVQVNTKLFFPIRQLSHDMELGLVIPLIDLIHHGDNVKYPLYEIQITLVKSCPFAAEDEQLHIYTDDDGRSVCVVDLLNLSTWPDNILF